MKSHKSSWNIIERSSGINSFAQLIGIKIAIHITCRLRRSAQLISNTSAWSYIQTEPHCHYRKENRPPIVLNCDGASITQGAKYWTFIFGDANINSALLTAIQNHKLWLTWVCHDFWRSSATGCLVGFLGMPALTWENHQRCVKTFLNWSTGMGRSGNIWSWTKRLTS